MSFINLANKSFTKNSKILSSNAINEGKLTTYEIDSKIFECKNNIKSIKERLDSIGDTWKALKEDYSMMSFAHVFDTTLKESMQKAIDDLKLEYEDAKNTLDFYKNLKNKTLLEADVTLGKDDMFDPSSISLSGIAKQSYDKEQQEIKMKELEAQRQKYREQANDIIIKVEESIENGDEPSETLEILFNEFVPQSGKATTLAGELVRAMMKILYRDWNDGDLFYTGYGIESSCGNAAAYLMNKEWYDDFNDIREQQLEGDAYTNALENITKNIIEYILDNPELLIEPNTEDYLKTSTEELEENQPRYEVELYFSEDLRELMDEDWFDIQDAVDYVENHLSWESVWNDAEVTIWSRYDDYVTVNNLTGDGRDRLEYEATGKRQDGFWEELVKELKEKYGSGEEDEDDIDESLSNDNTMYESFINLLNKNDNEDTKSLVYEELSRFGKDDEDIKDIFERLGEDNKKSLMNILS